jgi:FO synthase subunit 2
MVTQSGWGDTKPLARSDTAGPEAATSALELALGRWPGTLDSTVAGILDRALEGREITVDEGEVLFGTSGRELQALLLVADGLRRRAVGDHVTYVVNRNINFTNVCVKRCGFCAFSRGHLEEQGYFLPIGEVVRRAHEAWDLGATEVCIQAGLPPQMDGSLYVEICRAIKAELPDIHIHGFSPEEVLYGSARSRCTIEEYLERLRDAGVGSLPGTSAEILDDKVRDVISHGRISVRNWVRVITAAHRLGIPTTSTIMYGHVETLRHRAVHIALLRDIQRETGGITEFVPLSFVHSEAPMFRKGLVPGVRAGATGNDILKMYAVSRLMLNGFIKNIQVSWVKEGTKFAQTCLAAGANDFGGTLINESISTSAGATNGQLVRPAELRALIRDAGRVPVERTTTYQVRRVLAEEPEDPDLLDTVEDTTRFGSYQRLIAMDEFRYRPGIAREAVLR